MTPISVQTPSMDSTATGDVPKADPVSISIPAIKVKAAMKLYTVKDAANSKDTLTAAACYDASRDKITCVNPPTAMDVYWLKAGIGKIPYGSQPGTDATGNVYFSGHASSTKTAVFTTLYKLKPGDTITVTTSNGKLNYTVDRLIRVDKAGYNKLPEVNEQLPGRLIVATCDHSPDAPLTGGVAEENLVVVAHLKDATPSTK